MYSTVVKYVSDDRTFFHLPFYILVGRVFMRPNVVLEVPSVFVKVQIHSSHELSHHLSTSRPGHIMPKPTCLSICLLFIGVRLA